MSLALTKLALVLALNELALLTSLSNCYEE